MKIVFARIIVQFHKLHIFYKIPHLDQKKLCVGGDLYDPATNTRTIKQISKVYECSVVPFPAYPAASVEARSAQAASKKAYAEKRKAKILINQILKVRF